MQEHGPPRRHAGSRVGESLSDVLEAARATSAAFDAGVDRLLKPLRGRRGVQKVLFATSLVAQTVLVVAGGVKALTESPHRRAVRNRLATTAMVAGLNVATKRLINRNRPFDPDNRPVPVSPETSSYPSGHTLWALLAAAWLADDHWRPSVAYATAAFVSLSRVHLRLHRASDVVTTAAFTAGAWSCVRRWGVDRGVPLTTL